MVVLHSLVGWQFVHPDLSQRVGKIADLIDHWPQILLVLRALLDRHDTQHVAAGRDERQFVALFPRPSGATTLR